MSPQTSTHHNPRIVLAGNSARILCVADIRGDCECSAARAKLVLRDDSGMRALAWRKDHHLMHRP
jgi:hypothetical protein